MVGCKRERGFLVLNTRKLPGRQTRTATWDKILGYHGELVIHPWKSLYDTSLLDHAGRTLYGKECRDIHATCLVTTKDFSLGGRPLELSE